MTRTTHHRQGRDLVSTCLRCGCKRIVPAHPRQVVLASIDKFDREHKACKKAKEVVAVA